MTEKLNRREFIKASTLAAMGAALAGCATPTPTAAPATKAPAATQPPAAATQAPAATKAPEPTKAPAAPTAAPKPAAEIIVSRGEHPSQPILQDAPAHVATSKATNVKLTFQPVPDADYLTKFKLWMSTKQVPDVVRAGFNDIRDFANPSVFMPVLPLIDKYGPNLKNYLNSYPDVVKKLKMNNDLFIIPATSYHTKLLAPMPCIRKDLLDNAKLPVPKTFDELYTVLSELKKANPNTLGFTNRKPGTQSGIKRQLMISAYPFGSGVGGWSRGIDVLYWEEKEGKGKWLYGQIHDEFKEVLTYYAKLYKEKLMDPDFAISTADQWHEKNSSGKGLFSWDNFSFCVRWNTAVRGIDPKATWTPIPIIAGKKGARQNDYSGFAGSGGGWCIGAGCKNPDAVIKVLDWKLSPEGLDTCSWGIQDTHYTLKGTRPASITDYTEKNLQAVMPKANRALKPEIVEKFKTKADPFRSYQSETGTGQLDFGLLWDDAVIYTWDAPGEADAWYAMSTSDKALHPEVMLPSFTADESAKLKTIYTNVNAILDPLIDKVIVGQATLADWDKGVADAKKAGAEDLEKIHNDAEARG
jgi:putative aldouronate transport system substrate-binding protein